jgi:uncharacterized damage-inducible protein DinB
MIDHLMKLFDHLEWADARVLEGLRADPGSDPRALELYAHVLGAEHVWLARLRQRPALVAVWPTLSLDRCAALAAENAAGFRALLAGLAGEDDLAREVAYVNSAGQAFRSAVGDILLHVALHGAYHRGQVALVVRAAGGTPSPTDYIAFVRGVPAATRQSAVAAPAPRAG